MKLIYIAGILISLSYSQPAFSQSASSQEEALPQRAPATRTLRMPIRKGPQPEATTTTASMPTWTGTDGTYTYTMVGQNPVTALANQSITIPVEILPVALTFSDGTVLNPTVVDTTCSPAGSALTLLEDSPVFNNYAYTVGGTSVGTTTYLDFFQRASFWNYTSPTGVNPNYHTLFSLSPRAVTSLTVPAADGSTIAGTCGRLGQMSLTWFDAWVENTLIPAQGIVPSQYVVVLLYNAATYEPPATTPLILGYNSGFSNTSTNGAVQYYAVTDFDTTKLFGTTADTANLTHEMGEWLDDPLGTNPTPSYGNIGEAAGTCEGNLEVGVPLSNTNIAVTMSNSYTYHLQELTFFGWFYHNSPSTSVNGWYSSNNSLTTYAAACTANTATTTSLSLSSTAVTAGASVTATIAVKPATGTTIPTGTIALVTSTGTTLATLTLASGAATGSVTLPAGTYTVTAEYAGSSAFAASNSAAVSVNAAATTATTTTLSLSATSVTTTTPVTVSIGVKASSGTANPTGSVSLVSSTGTTLATFSLTSGAASGSLTLPAGTYTVTAEYAGAAGFTASNSTAVSVTSTAPVATTTALTLSSASVTAGASVTATVTVKAASGTVTPTGTVTITSTTGSGTGTTLATLTLASGAASGSIILAAGTYTVTAKYAGSTGFTASNSSAVSVVSSLIPTTTALSLSSTALPSGGADTATISVKPTSGTGSPTGTVALVSSTGAKITTVTLASGAWSGSVTLPSGSYTVTAEYSGDTTYASSNSPVVDINPAPVLTLSSTSLTYASTAEGSAAATQTITVTNTGTASETSLAIALSGTDAADFTSTTTCGSTLAVNASCSVLVTFKPAVSGSLTATLTIGTSTVALKGTATAAASKSTGSKGPIRGSR